MITPGGDPRIEAYACLTVLTPIVLWQCFAFARRAIATVTSAWSYDPENTLWRVGFPQLSAAIVLLQIGGFCAWFFADLTPTVLPLLIGR